MAGRLLEEEPFVLSVATSRLNDCCSSCLCKSTKLLRCGKCRLVHYCSTTCQQSDWSDHCHECKRVVQLNSIDKNKTRNLPADFPDDTLRLIGRLLRKLNKEEFKSEGRGFGDLTSHARQVVTLKKTRDAFDQFLELYSLFCRKPAKLLPKEKLLDVYCKVKVNAFGVKDEKLQSVGIGLYLSLSRLDHSCAPNGRIIFVGRTAKLVPTDLAKFALMTTPFELSSIRHSYIDNWNCRKARREQLRNDYFFECNCERCLDETFEARLTAFACQTQRLDGQVCAGVVVPAASSNYSCDTCASALDEGELATARMAASLAESVDKSLVKLESEDQLERRLELCAKAATVMEGVLHASNVVRMRVCRAAYQCCVQLNRWSDAVSYGKPMLDACRTYTGIYDPWLLVLQKNLIIVTANATAVDSGDVIQSLAAVAEFKEVAVLKVLAEKLTTVFGNESEDVLELRRILKKLSRK